MTAYRLDAADDPVRLAMSGHLDPSAVDGLLDTIDGWQPDDAPALIIDLTAVDSYDPAVRSTLVELERKLGQKTTRHVYLARTALMRGLSLWVLHMSGDTVGRTAGSDKQARAWLAADHGRLEHAFETILGAGRAPRRVHEGPVPRLSYTERMGAQSLSWIIRITQGYWPGFIRELVRTYGMAGMKQFGEAMEHATGRLAARFGDETGQVLIGMSAVWNGCAYCTIGHLYAANVLYFRRTGRLFPIDEREVPRWHAMTDERLEALTLERLAGDEFEELRRLLRRQFVLRREGPTAVADDDDALIVDINAAWEIVNECSIVIESTQVPPLHPTAARARGVQRAYAQKRGRDVSA